MVYCGKPSKACEECRIRRTKCDTLKPSCSQCVRAGRVCRGYRDPTDMMFRDESQALSTKRQRLANAKKPRYAATISTPTEIKLELVHRSAAKIVKPQFSYSNTNATNFLTLDLGTSAEQQAACFFFKNYVLEEHKFHNGHFQYLSDIYGCEEIGEPLAETVACLGLVGLANFWKASNIMSCARSKYNSALRLVSERLRNVEEAKADQTLIAVMLLGLYETNTCSGPQSMESWTKHINGAAALLNLRGKQQLRSPIGHNLFTHLRTQVITNCIQRKATVPPIIGEWSRAALEFETEAEATSTHLTEIATKYCNLRASMSHFRDYSNSEYLIASVEEAKADQTLIAVMLLGLYETNTCSGPQSMESWTKHINGAAALLNLRGKQQLRSPIGHNLFTHLRTQVITNCIQRKATVPPIIGEWSRAALEFETEAEATSTHLIEIATKYCNLRASMSHFRDYSNSEYLIASLVDIDREYTELLNRCPIPFLYTTVTLDKASEEVFSDHYHAYSSIWTASIWNYYRCVRILVNELILDQISHVLQFPEESPSSWDFIPFYETQILASNSTLQQLSHDICASVPFFLGYSVNPNARSSRPPPKAVSGNLLLWPLYTAACTGIVSDMMRVWVAGRLRFISDVMGIRQAAPLAYTLEIRQDLLEWDGETGDEGKSLMDCVG